MLNTTDISALITSPNNIGKDQLIELEKLAEKHPYTQLFSVLFLKGLANSKDVSFEEKLAKHSYRVGNRVQLYNLIHQFEAEETKNLQEKTETEVIPVSHKAIEIIEEEPTVINEVSDSIDRSVEPETEKPVKEEAIESEIDLEHESDPLEETILHNALVTNFKLEELSEEEENNLEIREQEKKIEDSEFNHEVEVSTASSNSFVSWLHADENYSEDDGLEKEAIDSVVNDFEGFDPLSELSGEIEKPKAEFFSPTRKGKESLNEENIPVSETLAKIYILQGNYPKAIEAYNQLSLKFPEKKIFFANLIEDLQKKLNT